MITITNFMQQTQILVTQPVGRKTNMMSHTFNEQLSEELRESSESTLPLSIKKK